ncbi:alpha/beta hydrolase [Noviherbaspirillum massiliense]|uniref:alpha/beta hydrolase n=1 Tax=Noviherbaspirillum massiliense TaxID=1465823 RepID=UPI000318267B|nr:alpha/beta hydrolase [Noviherbaspirillum massiliense]
MNAPRESLLAGSDDTPLFVTDWPADATHAFRGGILLMHGLGEHCGRYAHVARFFHARGWSVRAYDHRGHGRSGGKRGDAPHQGTLLTDAKIVLDEFARQLPTPPLLLGHSMGGLFAARFATAQLSPLRGLILSSPALAVRLSGAQRTLLKLMLGVAPGLPLPNGLQVDYLSHRRDVINAYRNDPLVHGKISARLLTAMLNAMDFSHTHASSLSVPTLMVVAGDDHLVDPRGSREFFAKLVPGIGRLHWYQDFYHEVFNEAEAARVFADVGNWLDDCIK